MSSSDVLYGTVPNGELIRLIGDVRGRILDIGCGAGALGLALRGLGADAVMGIDCDQRVAEQARGYDQVIIKPIESVVSGDLGIQFDWIVAADVLEHLIDPWKELRRWRSWGRNLAVSVPNVGHHSVLVGLLRGRFAYDPGGGVMDKSHLRWFTKRELARALMDAGWSPVRWGHPRLSRRATIANTFTAGAFEGLLSHQIHVVCE